MKSGKIMDEKGFTLIEAMVAVAILSFGILSLYMMVNTTITGNAGAQTITVASNVLTDQMEQLMALPYDDSQLSTSPQSPITTGLSQPISQIQWTTTEWSDDSEDNDGDGTVDEYDERGMKTIALTVTYTTLGTEKTHTIQFEKAEIY